ncbi:hypothetical protein [Clavibacter capsici]|uniref:hypothetical protein n=1 Tax=Clavibacter capsici TaxID=1874630 RepID=UPI001427F522|nr:hypothetical protein [Clavibacter capsici]QIS38594.1 hypothetical protein GW572_04265 [Clavibacter capsici]
MGTIYWAGRNNPDVAVNGRDARAVVASLRRSGAPFVILSMCNSATEALGSAGYATVMAVNAEYERAAGSDYFDIRGWLIRRGLAAAGITPTATDTSDIAKDVIPASLRSDDTHLNPAGYPAMGRRVAQLLNDKEWF